MVSQKKLFHSFDHILQCGDMICKCLFAVFCHGISGICLSSNKTLMHFDIPVFLEAYQVSGEVAVGYFEHLLQVVEADLIIDCQDTHHTKPDAVIK